MRFLILIIFSANVMAAGTWYQPPLYRQPGGSGKWTTTPPPSSSGPSNGAPWDGGIDVGVPSPAAPQPGQVAPKPSAPPVGSKGSRSRSSGSSGGRTHPAGTGLNFDIDGGARLARRIEAEEALKRYMDWLDFVRHRVADYLDQQPMTARDLKKLGYSHEAADPVMVQDKRQQALLDASGEALVMLGYMDRGQVIQLLHQLGVSVSTSTSPQEDIFADVYDRFQDLEAGYFNKLIESGRRSTDALTANAAGSVNQMNEAARTLTQVNSEFSAREEAVASRGIPPDMEARIARVENKIGAIDTSSPQGRDFKNLAQSAVGEARESAAVGAMGDANWYLSVAEGVADVALGLDPVTGFYRSLIEATTGYNVVTREKLGTFERSLAVFGVLTAGNSASAIRVLNLGRRLGGTGWLKVKRMIEVAHAAGQTVPVYIKTMQKFQRFAQKLESFPGKAKYLDDIGRAIHESHSEMIVDSFHSADELNELYRAMQPAGARGVFARPFRAHSYGVTGKLKRETRFVRFSESGDFTGKSVVKGRWIAVSNDMDFSKMNPNEIKQIFSLPDVPKYVTDVKLPEGTKVLKSKTSAEFGGVGGSDQYTIVGELKDSFFSNTRPIAGGSN